MSAYLTIEKGTRFADAIKVLMLQRDPKSCFGTWVPATATATLNTELRYDLSSTDWWTEASNLAKIAFLELSQHGYSPAECTLKKLPEREPVTPRANTYTCGSCWKSVVTPEDDRDVGEQWLAQHGPGCRVARKVASLEESFNGALTEALAERDSARRERDEAQARLVRLGPVIYVDPSSRTYAATRDAALDEAEKLRAQVEQLRDGLTDAIHALHHIDVSLRCGDKRRDVSDFIARAGTRADAVMGATKPETGDDDA